MQIKDKPGSPDGQQERADAWVRRAANLSEDSGDYELQILLIDTLLATKPFWSKLLSPGSLFGEEFLQALMEAVQQDAS